MESPQINDTGHKNITLTAAAAKQLRSVMNKQTGAEQFLRLSLKKGGCSGMSYVLSFDSEVHEQDQVFSSQGHKIVCDNEVFQFLNGLEIDFSDDLMHGGFKFANPNAAKTCGCGSSFSA